MLSRARPVHSDAGAILNLLEAFKAEQWDAQEVVIGDQGALEYEIVTPRETIKCMVMPGEGGRLYHFSASNSYSEQIATIIAGALKETSPGNLRPGTVAVIPVNFKAAAEFDRLVVAPPEIGLFNHFSEELRQAIYLVAPAYASEFSDGMSAKDFRHQIGRKDGWRVHVYRWNRIEKTSPSWD